MFFLSPASGASRYVLARSAYSPLPSSLQMLSEGLLSKFFTFTKIVALETTLLQYVLSPTNYIFNGPIPK